MVDLFAISGSGLTGTIVRPTAFVLAIAGGLIVPGAQVEAGMQPETREGTLVSANVTPSSSFLFGSQRDPDVLTNADILQTQTARAVAFSAGTFDMAPSPSRAASPHVALDRTMPSEVSGGLAIANQPALRSALRSARGLAFSQAFDEAHFPAPEAERLADPMSGDELPKDVSGAGSAALTADTPPEQVAGDLSGKAKADGLDLLAFDPFASKPLAGAAAAAGNPLPASTAAPAGLEFVSHPVVQPLPAPELAAKPEAIKPSAQLSPVKQAAREAAPSRLIAPAQVKSVSPAVTDKPAPSRALSTAPVTARSSSLRGLVTPKPLSPPKVVSGRHMPGYRIAGDVIEFTLSTSVNGERAAAIPLRVTKDDRLWLRTGDLLSLVKARMSPAEYERLASSPAMQEYVTFEAVRSAGISLQYDVARNLIAIGVD